MNHSTNNVIELTTFKEEHTPHLSGKARCLGCKNEWEAVAPVGTVWLECPKCTLQRGRFVAQVLRNEEYWLCKCGCDLFHVTKEGIYCPNCGTWQEGF